MEALALIGMETDPLEEAAGCNVVSFFLRGGISLNWVNVELTVGVAVDSRL